ncbi:glycosyltransferase [Gammaproteobacteria bacterium]|nr:glycosyltransferase [Gammaproteobacteria bacterium]
MPYTKYAVLERSPLVSIVVRSKNEEKWVSSCLRAVFNQSYKNFEVILVDNQSTDKTVEKAMSYPVKVVIIKNYRPGKAISLGVQNSSGEIIVCLSAHCVPTNHNWLKNLIANLSEPDIAAVYGRQEPLSFSSPFDKRDLLITFGLDKRVQVKDSFFHNANSALWRDTLDLYPFNEEVTNIEDRVWATDMIKKGYKIIYEPEASVYHYHGIHQDLDIERASKVVAIMESLEADARQNKRPYASDLEIIALIPSRAEPKYCDNQSLLEFTVTSALHAKHINEVIVATDNKKTSELATRLGANAPFLRPGFLSEEYIDISDVLKYSLEQIESKGRVPDLVVVLEETYPFRPDGLIDALIEGVVERGLDSLVACIEECRHIWLQQKGETRDFGDGFMPRRYKEHSAFVGLLGLGCVTHPKFIRAGDLLGKKVGIYEVHNPFCSIEIRNNEMFEFGLNLIKSYRNMTNSND